MKWDRITSFIEEFCLSAKPGGMAGMDTDIALTPQKKGLVSFSFLNYFIQ